MENSGDRDYNGEIGALRRIEIEEEIVRMLKIGIAAGPRVVVDATEAGQKQQGGPIVGGRVVYFFSAFFGIDEHGCKPLWYPLAQVLLKESLALDSVWAAAQNQRPIAEKRQDELGGSNCSWIGGGGGFVLQLAIHGTRILAEREENRMAQGVLLCPAAELNARN